MPNAIQPYLSGTPTEPERYGREYVFIGDLHCPSTFQRIGHHQVLYIAGPPADTVPRSQLYLKWIGKPDASLKAMRLAELRFKQAPRKVTICGECGVGRRQ